MKQLLPTMLLCALGIAQASAQNTVSQELLELSEDQRNAAFTRMLRASDRNCDQVIRCVVQKPKFVFVEPAFRNGFADYGAELP